MLVAHLKSISAFKHNFTVKTRGLCCNRLTALTAYNTRQPTTHDNKIYQKYATLAYAFIKGKNKKKESKAKSVCREFKFDGARLPPWLQQAHIVMTHLSALLNYDVFQTNSNTKFLGSHVNRDCFH